VATNIQRVDTNRIPKQALQYRPKGRRNIGRPRKRWRDKLYLEGQGKGNGPNCSWTWRWWCKFFPPKTQEGVKWEEAFPKDVSSTVAGRNCPVSNIVLHEMPQTVPESWAHCINCGTNAGLTVLIVARLLGLLYKLWHDRWAHCINSGTIDRLAL
jgi:hypothetical protein